MTRCGQCGRFNAIVNQCRCDPNNLPTRFERQPAVIAQESDGYYVLRSPGVVDMGGTNKQRLAAWARSHGFSVTFTGERPKVMRVEHGL